MQIADLSYRNYDGPLESPNWRWWVIARSSILRAFKMKSYWIATAFAGWYYLAMITVLFFIEQTTEANPQSRQMLGAFIKRLIWKDQFLHGFSFAQLLILLTALLLGAGAIANDNRANALLVYLSKPCSKLDYIVGKWVGIFLPLLLMMLIPSAVFYLYGLMSFREYGFWKDDPWLAPKMLAIMPLSAAQHSSLVLAISSMFQQGRIAGAAYAGLYFLTNFFTILMKFGYAMKHGEDVGPVGTLFYMSVDGIQIGLAKAILGTNGTPYFGIQQPKSRPPIPAPGLIPFALIVIGVTVVCLYYTWRRVRAVEVVG
jgi:ABC-2 type transport system permease protein